MVVCSNPVAFTQKTRETFFSYYNQFRYYWIMSFVIMLSAITSSDTINILRFLFGLHSPIFLYHLYFYISSILLDKKHHLYHLIKDLEQLKCFNLEPFRLTIHFFVSCGYLSYK